MIRTRRVDFGLGTSVACHMANLSYLQNKRLYWDAERRQVLS